MSVKIRLMMAGLLLAIGVLALAACSSTPTPPPAVPTAVPPPPAVATATPPVPTAAVVATATPPSNQENDATWLDIQQTGIMRVGTSGNYAPFESYDAQFQLDGFDIALMNAIGAKLGVQIKFTDFAFEGLPGALQANQIDAAIAAISVTPERQELADFSRVYYSGTDGIVAVSDSALQIHSIEDLARLRVGVQNGSVYETLLEQRLVNGQRMPRTDVFAYADLSNAFNDLTEGKIDVVWMDLLPAQTAVQQRGLKLVGQGLNPQLYAIALRKDSPVLRGKINAALTELQSSGAVAILAKKYLQTGDTPLPTPVPELPTATPPPVPATAAPPPPCVDGMGWVADLTYDDKNMTAPPVLQPGQPFTKSWRVKNTGTCPWTTGYLLAYVRGNSPLAQMGGSAVPVTQVVNPGATYDFSVNLVAPTQYGTYQGFWQMKNAAGVPFGQTIYVGIQVPPPAPPPTQTPVASIQFTANPTSVTAGQPVNFSWNVQNVKEVYFYWDGEDWRNHGVPGVGTSTQYPTRSQNYYLRVVQNNNEVVTRTIYITVIPVPNAPVINQFFASPGSIVQGQCTALNWSVSGQVNQVNIARGNTAIWNSAPVSGQMQDCPPGQGTITYNLTASGPGGTSRASANVTVNLKPPTEPIIKYLTATPEQIYFGECVIIQWSVDSKSTNITLDRYDQSGLKAQLKRDALPNDGYQDCGMPEGQYTYRLSATPGGGGAVQTKDVYVTVQPQLQVQPH